MRMFRLERQGSSPDRLRLIAPDGLTDADFEDLAVQVGAQPLRVQKVGFVSARRAERTEAVETRWNGKESSDIAAPGDFIVTNMSPERAVLRDKAGKANTYVIRAEKFLQLYESGHGETDFGRVYRARGVVSAL